MPEQTIVVGIDGSECSLDALRWAVGQARVVHAELDIVTTWHFPTDVSWGLAPPLPEWDLARETAEWLRETVKREVPTDFHSWGFGPGKNR
jgi:nucleotide-binding universal stress UspA family protein